MRVRCASFAVALLLALALASCSGGEQPQAASPPAPASTPAPTAPVTPAPTAAAVTPEATPTPEATLTPTPEQACANGVAVADPEATPVLAADCEALLSSMDALRGDASLDWGGGLAIADWEGVAVSGEPPRATGLDLRGKGLTGSIPRALRRLPLGEALFAGNALTGCVPSAFEDAATHDAASLGLPWCLRYDRLDAAGEVASAGEWAILGGNGEALTTWEGLRSGAATLRVHETDAGGTSWASEFGAVAVNDLFEWREASDCWVRYRVAGAPAAPPISPGRWEFPIEWMTYAATGAGCTGAVGSGTVLRADEAAPDVIPAAGIASPLRHGAWLLIPTDWSGRREATGKDGDSLRATGNIVEPKLAVPAQGQVEGNPGATGYFAPSRVETSDIAEARRLIPLWRDPVLPAGWRLDRAEAGTDDSPVSGYSAWYVNAHGYPAVWIRVFHADVQPLYKWAPRGAASALVDEARSIDGHAILVEYSPPGPNHSRLALTKVQIFNAGMGVVYWLRGQDRSLQGSRIDPVIEIGRSLYRTTVP